MTAKQAKANAKKMFGKNGIAMKDPYRMSKFPCLVGILDGAWLEVKGLGKNWDEAIDNALSRTAKEA